MRWEKGRVNLIQSLWASLSPSRLYRMAFAAQLGSQPGVYVLCVSLSSRVAGGGRLTSLDWSSLISQVGLMLDVPPMST